MILIPQLLLSGTVINFTKLYKPFASQKYTPFIGDAIVSRWTYEALMVTQFSDNLYQKHLFEVEKKFENANYYSSSYYDKIEVISGYLERNKNKEDQKDLLQRRFRILKNEILKTEELTGKKFKYFDQLSIEKYDSTMNAEVISYFYYNLKYPNLQIVKEGRTERDNIISQMAINFGDPEMVTKLKEDNFNDKIEDFVTNKTELENVIEGKNELIRRYRPIYQEPESNWGRAQFYASEKVLFGFHIKTIWFNVGFIAAFTILLYIVLISQLLDLDSSPFKRPKYK